MRRHWVLVGRQDRIFCHRLVIPGRRNHPQQVDGVCVDRAVQQDREPALEVEVFGPLVEEDRVLVPGVVVLELGEVVLEPGEAVLELGEAVLDPWEVDRVGRKSLLAGVHSVEAGAFEEVDRLEEDIVEEAVLVCTADHHIHRRPVDDHHRR
jgi:hypothetical protein